MKKLFLILDLITGIVISFVTLPICFYVFVYNQDNLHFILLVFVLCLTCCSDYLGLKSIKNRIKEIKDL